MAAHANRKCQQCKPSHDHHSRALENYTSASPVSAALVWESQALSPATAVPGSTEPSMSLQTPLLKTFLNSSVQSLILQAAFVTGYEDLAFSAALRDWRNRTGGTIFACGSRGGLAISYEARSDSFS